MRKNRDVFRTPGRVLMAMLFTTAVPAGQYDDHAATESFNRALGMECTHCHVEGRWAEEGRPARATARRMIAMVDEITAMLQAHRGGRITCWTCHGGRTTPAMLPRELSEDVLAMWPPQLSTTPADVKRTMAVYTASVGRTCAGCHEGGGTGAATAEAREVVALMNSFVAVAEKYLPATAPVQCFTCHKGRPHPQTSSR